MFDEVKAKVKRESWATGHESQSQKRYATTWLWLLTSIDRNSTHLWALYDVPLI